MESDFSRSDWKQESDRVISLKKFPVRILYLAKLSINCMGKNKVIFQTFKVSNILPPLYLSSGS